MSRWKALPWLLGVALLAVTLVAAVNLPTGDTAPRGGGGGPPVGSSAPPTGGLTVVGTFDAAAGVMPVHPPGAVGVGALTVKKVHVKDGDTVAAGATLIEFDPGPLVAKKMQAENAHIAAQWAAEAAARGEKEHDLQVKLADVAVEKAELDLKQATDARDRISEAMERQLKLDIPGLNRPPNEEEKTQRRREHMDLFKAETAIKQAEIGVRKAKLDRERLDNSDWKDKKGQATAQVAAYKADIDAATAAIAALTVKAETGGVIEQVGVSEGMSVAVGAGARTPLFYLVPTGPRVVRAEVEAEFAHKIDPFLGQKVTIYDAHNFNNTYTGVARRVSGAFLPKRFGGDSLVGTPTRALECVIDVPDPAPPGKPPLRPGQPVRVMFGP